MTTRESHYTSPLLSPDAAAAYLQINPRTLANWRVQGKSPKFVRSGRRPLYRRVDLDEWIDKHVYDHTAAERTGQKHERLGALERPDRGVR